MAAVRLRALIAVLVCLTAPGAGRHRALGRIRRLLGGAADRRDRAAQRRRVGGGSAAAIVAWYTRASVGPCAGCGNPSVEELCTTCVIEGWELRHGGLLVNRRPPVAPARRQDCLDTIELPVLADAVAERDATAEVLLPADAAWVSS